MKIVGKTMSERKMQNNITKSLKFTIKLKEGQKNILQKLTARHTFAVKEYLKVIEQEEHFIKLTEKNHQGRLDQLTILTRNRETVLHDLKEVTGLSTTTLQACGRKALQIWNKYKVVSDKYTKRIENASCSVMTSMLKNIIIAIDDKGRIISESLTLEETLSELQRTRLWKKITKNKPSPPLQSREYKPKKIPIHLGYNTTLLPYYSNNQKSYYKKTNKSIIVKISTLKKGNPIELELPSSKYHNGQLEIGRVTGGQIVKNEKKKRWEFHASLLQEIPNTCSQKGQVIIGIDLGINVDATVVAMIENEKIKQPNIHFLKEPDLRRKKFNIDQRIKTIQKKKDTLNRGYAYKHAIQELKNLSGKRAQLTRLACHRISKQVCTVVKKFIDQGYETHITIGKLQGLKIRNQRGNGRGKKFRGRINKFPYAMLKEFIFYKSRELGVKYFSEVNEAWTSKTCHKCESTNTERPTQAQFICNDCGLQYNADVNGAINIAKRYWVYTACGNCRSLKTKTNYDLGEIKCSECNNVIPLRENKRRNSEHVTMIFLIRKSEGKRKSQDHCSIPQGTSDSPSCNESAGTVIVHSKVEEARKRKNHEASTDNF